MKLNDAFPSNWIKAADCEDQNLVLTIKSAEMEEIKGQKGSETKLVLKFREIDKGMICNKTNATTISKLYGDDTDDWLGKRVTLYSAEVQFGNEMVMSIRVSVKPPKGPAPAEKAKATTSKVAASVEDLDDEDEMDSIPF